MVPPDQRLRWRWWHHHQHLLGGVTWAAAAATDAITDADADTKIQVEEGSDEDIIRFDTAGTEQMTIKADGTITLTQGLDDVNAVLAVQIFR